MEGDGDEDGGEDGGNGDSMALTDLLRTQREGQRFQASNLREGPMHMKKLTGSGWGADFVSV